MNFDSVYDMLRVDFGRDDVIKYVIYKEFFKQNHILDYPGQSFFSTLFIFIPRIIWPSKPFVMACPLIFILKSMLKTYAMERLKLTDYHLEMNAL